MARYRLMEKDNMGNKIGPHLCGKVVKGRFTERYTAGSIIESDQPLDQQFRGKFVKMDDVKAEPDAAEPKTAKAKGRSRK